MVGFLLAETLTRGGGLASGDPVTRRSKGTKDIEKCGNVFGNHGEPRRKNIGGERKDGDSDRGGMMTSII